MVLFRLEIESLCSCNSVKNDIVLDLGWALNPGTSPYRRHKRRWPRDRAQGKMKTKIRVRQLQAKGHQDLLTAASHKERKQGADSLSELPEVPIMPAP